MSVAARQIVLAARPHGCPQLSDFHLEDAVVPELRAGEVLVRVLYLSLDPYMRGRMNAGRSYAKPVELGAVMVGEGIAEVLESKDPEYREGDVVLAGTGWRTHAVLSGSTLRKIDASQVPVTTRLGVLGMPGFTAYAGLHAIGKPRTGETVVVAAASGPVGSLVGQLAKIAGARSVGIAGGSEKCAYVKDELAFDAAVDHRDSDFPRLLAAACPNGIDVYFENVGGAVWQAVLPLLNDFARVPVCGLVAQYNATENSGPDKLAATMREILSRSLTLRGFLNYEFLPEYCDSFVRDVEAGIAGGRIRYREDIVDGLENAPAKFIGMLDGKNFGKVLVRVG